MKKVEKTTRQFRYDLNHIPYDYTGLSERSYSTFKVRKGSHEKIPLIQSKEQWLRFAGAAMKRYPMSKVRETQVRW